MLLEININVLDMCPSFQVVYSRGQQRDITAVTSLIQTLLASLGSQSQFLVVSVVEECPTVVQTLQ